MDNKGFIFTVDAVLALIPVFIVLVTVCGVDQGSLILPSQQVRLNHQAQDALDSMSHYNSTQNTLIERMVIVLEKDNNGQAGVHAAGDLARAYLDNDLRGMEYKLVELNHLDGATIISKGDIDNAQNVAVGSKNYDGYSFKLYMWDSTT